MAMNRTLSNPVKMMASIVAIIVIIWSASKLHARFDLTSEKRYTLSPTTKQILGNMQDTVHITIYLEGNLPVSFYRMKREINDLLEEFKECADDRLEFEFVNPVDEGSNSNTEKTFKYLTSSELVPYTIQEKDEQGKQVSRVVFPGAIALSRNKSVSINFLKTNVLADADQNLHNAIQGLEYELINAVRKLSMKDKQKVCFITGHGELDKNQVASLTKALEEYYLVDRVRLDSTIGQLDKYRATIIAKPSSAFNETDKLVIDQYIMNGGRVLWALDFVNVPEDSLRYQRMVLGLPNQLNLDDQIFKYGMRVNYNVILDNQCALIPLNVAAEGAAPQFNPSPWYFYPLLTPPSYHPVTKNLNVIKAQYASVLDTVGDNAGIKRTVLLQSSDYSRVLSTPVPVSFDILDQHPDQYFFNKFKLPIAILEEGSFPSVFVNRMLPDVKNPSSVKRVEKSKRTAMLVIADGDILRNDVRKLAYDTIPLPLGFDKYTKETFGNKDFVLNAVNYLCDDSGLLNLRSRELKIRLLNKERIVEERTMWQIINMLLPLVMLCVAGIVITIIRHKIYRRS